MCQFRSSKYDFPYARLRVQALFNSSIRFLKHSCTLVDHKLIKNSIEYCRFFSSFTDITAWKLAKPVSVPTMSRLRCLQLELRSAGGLASTIRGLSASGGLLVCAAVPLNSLRHTHSERPRFKYFPNRDLHPPPAFENVRMPERHRLPIMPRTPTLWTTGVMKPPKQTKVEREFWGKGNLLISQDR